jgi:glucoamylase
VSDPWRMLSSRRRLTAHQDATAPGNVVQAAQTRLNGVGRRTRMTLAVGFGRDGGAAQRAARRSLATGFAAAAGRYAQGWATYLRGLKPPPAPVAADPRLRALYRQSPMTLAAHEDKANRGAYVASPTMPWVWGKLTLEGKPTSGPYHLVWPRDLFHIATALKAAGDDAGALRALDYLWRVQKPDGSWWQNTRVDGREHWTTTQMDQVALPVVLAWWLGRSAAADWEHVRRAADFLVSNGPRTGQERWENQDGWSPNTIATSIAGLICAAEVADANGDPARAASYRATADDRQRRVQEWTAATNGPYSPQPYYVRVTKDGDPDDGSTYGLGDNFLRPVDEREIVDPSFLGLVLFGTKRFDDPTVLNTLRIVDRVRDAQPGGLRFDTPQGPQWHRFTFDGYGETRDGADWNIFPTAENQTLGRLWPLLAGERGEYELIAGRDATPFLRSVAGSANDGLMLPEQVWDGRPPTGAPGAALGTPTRSATPLAWTHGQFVRLAWSIQERRPVELPSVAAARYAGP